MNTNSSAREACDRLEKSLNDEETLDITSLDLQDEEEDEYRHLIGEGSQVRDACYQQQTRPSTRASQRSDIDDYLPDCEQQRKIVNWPLDRLFNTMFKPRREFSSASELVDNYSNACTKERENKLYKRKLPAHLHSKRKKEFLLLVALLALFCSSLIFLVKLWSLMPPRPSATPPPPLLLETQPDSERWLVATPMCHIPVLDPWDPSIKEYVRRTKPLNCSLLIGNKLGYEDLRPRTLSFVRSNKIYLTRAAIEMGALDAHENGACCLRSVERAFENDDGLEYLEQCVPMIEQGMGPSPSNNISSLVQIECPRLNYTNVHTLIVHSKEDEDAYERLAASSLKPDSYYNILMLGIDTISRLNGFRQLNKTLNLLRQQYETLEFVGYNKVGENTFPNLIPLLTGLNPKQLTEVQCWTPKNYKEDNDRGDDYLDNCKYLWNFYQQFGYLTYYSEDWPAASTFNYLKPGFRREPTTFYGRPFTKAREELVFPKFKNSIGCASCQLDTPLVQVDLDNLKSFLEQHRDRPYFVFHWINCPQHDDLNGASQFDHLTEQFFSDIRNSTKLERTFVIFFSDHGYRWNDFVSTRVGHYESSLPLLTIAAPSHFIQRHPDLYKNLQEHQTALLTPYDMFKTLIAIRDLGAKREANVARSRRDVDTTSEPAITDKSTTPMPMTTIDYPTASTSIAQLQISNGLSYKQKFKTISLLDKHTRDELDRSCIEAGIPDNFCVCHKFVTIEPTSLDVIGAAYYLVYAHMDAQIKSHQKICFILDLQTVHGAQVFDYEKTASTSGKITKRRRRRQAPQLSISTGLTNSNDLSTTLRPAESRVIPANNDSINETDKVYPHLPNREYKLKISTKPGGGLFQEVVRFYGDDLEKCLAEVSKARSVIEDSWATHEDKFAIVARMNQICEFSIHSESISRLNLYKEQSKCVKNNIELKKICYCK